MRRLILIFLIFSHCAYGDYFDELTPIEKSDIKHMILMLSNTSAIELAFKQSELQSVGNRTRHIHPFRFFAFVITDPQLRPSFKKMSGIVWSRFRKGMGGSFASSARDNELGEEIISDFSKQTGIERIYIDPFVSKRQWEKLIDSFRAHS